MTKSLAFRCLVWYMRHCHIAVALVLQLMRIGDDADGGCDGDCEWMGLSRSATM